VALVVAVVATTMGVVLASLESFLLCGLAGALLLGATAPFLLPTRYTVTDDDVEVARGLRRTRRRLVDLRRMEVGDDRILLSPLARPSWLDRYRGLTLELDGAARDRVLDHLRARLGR
jgi:hypothetical protein